MTIRRNDDPPDDEGVYEFPRGNVWFAHTEGDEVFAYVPEKSDRDGETVIDKLKTIAHHEAMALVADHGEKVAMTCETLEDAADVLALFPDSLGREAALKLYMAIQAAHAAMICMAEIVDQPGLQHFKDILAEVGVDLRKKMAGCREVKL